MAITLQQAQDNLDALVTAAQSAMQTVQIQTDTGSRLVRYVDFQESINYWSRVVARLERSAAGKGRHNWSAGSFSR